MLVLTVTKGPDQGKHIPLQPGERYTVGTGEESFVLSDPRVLSPHCSVQTDAQGRVLLVNETASAGTFVGDKKIGRVLIKPGTPFRIGDTVLTVQAAAPRPAAPVHATSTPAAHTPTGSGNGKRRRVLDQQNDPLLGTIVGGYKINEVVGRGGMGTVYKATQLSLHREVALKVLRPSLAKDENFRQLFINEARAAAQLVDPNVVQVYDAGTEGDISFFSMEYIGQGSIEEVLEDQGKIPWEEGILQVLEAAHGLLYAEGKGIVHRDIKPDNLMINDDGRIKIADLGLAKKGESARNDGIIGTPHFIPPEQALGKDVDIRADIYSLGCTFFRMITGRTVFTGQTAKEIVLKHIKEPAPAASSLEKGVPGDLELVIAKMMAKEPDRRYAGAKELIAALEEVCAHHGIKGSVIKRGVSKKVLIPLAIVVLVGAWFAYDLISTSREARQIQEQEAKLAQEREQQAKAEKEREREKSERLQRLNQVQQHWNPLALSYYELDNKQPLDETYDDTDAAVRQAREKLWTDKAAEFKAFAEDADLEEFEAEHGFAAKANERASQITARLAKLKESAADKRLWNETHLAKVAAIDKRLRGDVDAMLKGSRYEHAWRLAQDYGAPPDKRGKDDPYAEIESAEWVSPIDATVRTPVARFTKIVGSIVESRKYFETLAARIPEMAGTEWAKVKASADAVTDEASDAQVQAVIDRLQKIEQTFCDRDEPHLEPIQTYVREAAAIRISLIARLEKRQRERLQRDRNLVRDVLRVQASLDPQVSPNNVMQLEIDAAKQAWQQLLNEGDRAVGSDRYRRYVEQRLLMLDWIRYLFGRFRTDLAATLADRSNGPLSDLDFDLPKPGGETMRVRLEAPPESPWEFAFYPKYKAEGQRSFGSMPMDWVYREIFKVGDDGGALRWRTPDPQLQFALGAFCYETMQFAAAREHFAALVGDEDFGTVARALAARAETEQAAYDDYIEIVRGIEAATKSAELETLRQQIDGYRQKHEGTRVWIEVMPRGNDDVAKDFVDDPPLPQAPE